MGNAPSTHYQEVKEDQRREVDSELPGEDERNNVKLSVIDGLSARTFLDNITGSALFVPRTCKLVRSKFAFPSRPCNPLLWNLLSANLFASQDTPQKFSLA